MTNELKKKIYLQYELIRDSIIIFDASKFSLFGFSFTYLINTSLCLCKFKTLGKHKSDNFSLFCDLISWYVFIVDWIYLIHDTSFFAFCWTAVSPGIQASHSNINSFAVKGYVIVFKLFEALLSAFHYSAIRKTAKKINRL